MRLYTLILLIVLSLCNSNKVLAEKEYVFDFSMPIAVPIGHGCKSLRVIDLRKNKNNIGYVAKGAFNKTMSLVTEKPLDASLAEAYKAIKFIDVADDELVLVLHTFEVKDRLDEDESGTFRICGDFFRGTGDQFTFLGSVDSLFEMRSGSDVTKLLLLSTKVKLNYLMSYFGSRPANIGKYYSLAELTEKHKNDKLPYAIYKKESFKKGIYYTKEDFLNNKPADVAFVRKTYTRDGGLKMHYFHYADERGKKGDRIKENSFFAIYDGEDWWVTNGTYCTIMKYTDDDFFALQFFKHGYIGQGSTGIASGASVGFMFGAVGALIGAGVGAGMDALVGNKNGKHSEWGLYRARFDPLSKDFIPIDRPNTPQ